MDFGNLPNKSTEREFRKVPLDPVSSSMMFFRNPGMAFVLGDMRSILMMLAMGLLPSPIRSQDRGMSNMTTQII